MDKTRLLKLLHLSESTNDNEALSSIRKINLLIKEDNLSWEDIINISDDLEKVIKRNRKEYCQLEFILNRERVNSQDLEERLKFSETFLKYVIVVIFILTIIVILK